MSRVIKFRAWDRAYQAMGRAGETKNLSAWLQNPEVFEVMQYTGLKDKNGVEIYEGDIVKPVGYNPVAQVMFEEGAFVVSNPAVAGHPNLGDVLLHSPLTYEVIGNIYENQELLEKAS